MRTHLDLFSGIGGFALAAGWAGYSTTLFVEIDPYCRRVLAKNFPGVPIHDDIRTLTGGIVGRPIDLLTGGFPCQPFSHAGKRRGTEDDRFLWPEMRRVVGETQPTFVLAENVTGIVNLALDDCLADLEALGYSTGAVVVPACAVGAPHRRDRVWIVAQHSHGKREAPIGSVRERSNSEPARGGEGFSLADAGGGEGEQRRDPAMFGRWTPSPEQAGLGGRGVPVVDAIGIGRGRVTHASARNDYDRDDAGWQEEARRAEQRGEVDDAGWPADDAVRERYVQQDDGIRTGRDGTLDAGWWATEPDVGRVAHGIPGRVDRLRALGNAIVPQVAYEIISALSR